MNHRPYNVLVVASTNKALHNLLKNSKKLQEEVILIAASSLNDAEQTIGSSEIDAVIVDINIGSTSLIEFNYQQPQLPTLLAGDLSAELSVDELIHEGMYDFLDVTNLPLTSIVTSIKLCISRYAAQGIAHAWHHPILHKLKSMEHIFSFTPQKEYSTSNQIHKMLKASCELFGEQFCFIYRLMNDQFAVDFQHTTIEQKPLFSLPIQEKLNYLTINSPNPIHFTYQQLSEHFSEAQLEQATKSYMGCRIIVQEKVYGVLCLFSNMPRVVPYTGIDISFLKILAEWTGTLLSRQLIIDQLQYTETHDALTGLLKRYSFLDQLKRCFARSLLSNNYSFALIILDINNFKEINEQFGHTAGDALLKQVATRLQANTRPKDTVGRFASDEFIVIVEDADRQQAEQCCMRIHSAFTEPFEIENTKKNVTCAIGFAISNEHQTEHNLLNAAESMQVKA
ncbi:sensor domain-containing diguanylate cyclase [Zooshikella sp. RANM57]|uniref:sensor domain-containing diguanylate cyclase n=1 Tax=Zooshikella sp. RANM57 TaxID=3425863 RepID=UPI003D6E46BC